MDSLPTNHQSARRAFWISAGLHVALFTAVICTALFTPPPPPPTRALLVRTVSLKAGSTVRITAAPKAQAAPTKGQGPAQKQAEPSPAPQKSAEEIIAENEPERPSAEVLENPKAPKNEESAPEEPLESVQKATPSPKASSKAATPSKPTTSAKPSTTAKTTTTSKNKPTKASAAGSKTATSKGKQPPKSSTSTQKSSTPQYDQNLLSDALRRLDRSKSAATKGGGGSGSGSGNSSGSAEVARVGTVGTLNVESGLVSGIGESGGDDTYEGYSTASPEACYIGDLIRRLQLNVRLPEPGEVRVKLSLTRNGAVSSIQVLSSNKPSIKQAIEKKLRAVHFSPFGTSFSGETEHTFNLRLSNDLVWSCR